MNSEQYGKTKEIFLAACEKPADERAAFVAQAADGDTAILHEVESLLKEHHSGAKAIPENPEPPLGSMSAILSHAGIDMPGTGAGDDPSTPTAGVETRFLDDAHDQTSTSRSGIIDAGRFTAGTVAAERYRIIEMLGRGGMGEVYRADDLKLNQSIALKFLPALFGQDAKWLERFHNEVRLARQVTHPNVCRVFDIGEFQGEQFISMEYVDGENLASLLRRIGRVPHDKAVLLARQLCAGIAAAHERGVLHRDLKPANVMIDGRGAVRITDFGLAAPMDELRQEAGLQGVRAGTPAYMSPEQLAGKAVTVRSDVYSLGLVLYEMFTGRRAFKADSLRGYQKAHTSDHPTPPSEILEDIDPIVDRAIMRCLEKDPKDRPASAMAVLAALPGGNPLREILAAGETPSPEMVAAAGEAHGVMKPRTAIALLLTALACLIGFVAMAPQVFTVQKALAPQDFHQPNTPDSANGLTAKEPAVLADNAQSILRTLGYAASPVDSAYGFDVNRSYYLHVDASDPRKDPAATSRLWQLWRPRLGLVYFWYRQSPEPLVPLRPEGSVEERDPAPGLPGMVRVRLDVLGRLIGLEVEPQTPLPSAATPSASLAATAAAPAPSYHDWDALLAAAGLQADRDKLTLATPIGSPPVFADERRAWDGILSDARGERVHIEAAAFVGKPVYFAIIGNWPEERFSETHAQVLSIGKWNLLVQTVVTAALLLAGGVLAFRNYHSGRGDRSGAIRMALAFFILGAIAWVLDAHHVADPVFEFLLFRRGMGSVLYSVSIIWIFYMALEPYVRRVWPETVISWNRLLAGKWIDPLVGRDVLAGAAVGVMTTLLSMVEYQIPHWTGEQILPVPLPSITSVSAMLASTASLGDLFSRATSALTAGLVLLLFLVLARMVLKRFSIAVALSVIIFVVATARYNVEGSWWPLKPETLLSLVIQSLLAITFFIVLTRHGLVALIFCLLARSLLMDFPVTWDFHAWYSAASLRGIIPTVVILLLAFYAARGGRLPALAKRAEPG